MLDCSDSFNATLNLLDQQDGSVEIPTELDDFFEPTGPLPRVLHDQRRFPRHYYRKRAILEQKDGLSRVFMINLSRESISFLHSQQLFPLDRVRLWVEAGVCMKVKIVRCRRIEDRCFECGARLLSNEGDDKEVGAPALPEQVQRDEAPGAQSSV